ncbi:MAG: cellulose synthase operon protein YhjQ/BcsQ [Sneathiella sp.]
MTLSTKLPAVSVQTSGDFDLDIVAIVSDRATKDQVADLLKNSGRVKFDVWQGRIEDVIGKFQNTKSPASLIVDISNEISPVSELEKLAKICTPNVNVIVFGNQDSVAMYRDVLAMGAVDYLVKPIASDLLLEALDRSNADYLARPSNNQSGKTIAVLGVRGGVGSTTVVANIGWVLSTIFGYKVTLTDFNLCNGSLALDLGLTSSSAFSELLRDPSRIDGVFVKRATSTYGKNLDILSTDDGSDKSIEVAGESIFRLMKILKREYRFIIQDLQRFPFGGAIGMLEAADTRVLVINKTLAAVRDCGRILSKLTCEDSKKTLVILNNVTQSTRNDVPIGKIQSFIERPVDLVIPYEKYIMATAHLQGEVASKNSGPVQDAYKEIAGQIVGPNLALPKPKKWLTALIGR